MINDFHFTFPGFTATGYCHLRVAAKNNESKMVIVCSQYKNYFGTSVTNAVETIVQKFFYDVALNNISNIEIPNLSENTTIYKNENSFTQFFRKLTLQKNKSETQKIILNIPKLFNNVIWIERYTPGNGLLEFEDHCRLVHMDEKFNPVWGRKVTDEFIRKETGFSLSELLINEDELDLKNINN